MKAPLPSSPSRKSNASAGKQAEEVVALSSNSSLASALGLDSSLGLDEPGLDLLKSPASKSVTGWGALSTSLKLQSQNNQPGGVYQMPGSVVPIPVSKPQRPTPRELSPNRMAVSSRTREVSATNTGGSQEMGLGSPAPQQGRLYADMLSEYLLSDGE
eukprot:CAMPEP_0185776660 /NCGR_PEP_ID=MMETSP1174-20130828/86517_1 /TAXON_ID=35687 /ORGANISM="Dictyocha speculum, Strain CCMP1381" /LENGTH=157 /DNA_ID=CAMNT_0028464707 /DNA_START=54 /DNA_END=527 /DNA_ORIENTATION=+